MSDSIAAFIANQDHGTVERSIALKSTLAVPGQADALAHVCQTERGVWLVAATSPEHGRAFDLLDDSLRYHEKPIGDQLELDRQTYAVKLGDGSKVKEALAIGRLVAAAERRRDLSAVPTAPFFPNLTEVERVWIETYLEPDEELLAWLETSTRKTVGSHTLPGAEAELRYLLTSRRHALVTISAVGDVDPQELPWKPLALTDTIGRDTVNVGDASWRTAVSSDKLFHQIADVPGMEAAAAIRAAARLSWLRWSGAGAAEARRLLLSDVVPRPPLTVITGLILEQLSRDAATPPTDSEREQLAVGLRALRDQQGSSSQILVEWLEAWQVPPTDGLAVLGIALADEESSELARWALPLHRHVHQRLRDEEKEPDKIVARDVGFAEHLLWAEELDEARELLSALVDELPAQELVDLLPSPETDITTGSQQLRIFLLELLARAGLSAEQGARALARSQPLVPSRMEALAAASEGPLHQRADAARALLEPGGLARAPTDPDNQPAGQRAIAALSPEQREVLRHPAAREGNVLGRLTLWIARSEVPDYDHLRAHCEKVSAEALPAVTEAVADACLALAMPSTPTYISRGEKSVGLCAYEGDPAFLLIGSQHLDPDSEYFLTQEELRFAVGAELANLRFEHARITSQDYYRGALDKGVKAAALVATVLPLIRYIPLEALIGRSGVYRWVRSVVPLSVLKRIYKLEDGRQLASAVGGNLGPLVDAGAGGLEMARQTIRATRDRAGTLLGQSGEGEAEAKADIGPESAKLVVLCRVLQLTADRSGLLLGGSLNAGIRALFLTSTRYQRELGLAEQRGLVACLSRRDDDGRMLFEELAVRIAALVAFSLSADYARLREALAAS